MDNSIQAHQKELCNKLWAMANGVDSCCRVVAHMVWNPVCIQSDNVYNSGRISGIYLAKASGTPVDGCTN